MKEAKPFVIDPKVMSMHKELSVKSRVRGDFHARFCERVRVKLPRSTRRVPRGAHLYKGLATFHIRCSRNCQ